MGITKYICNTVLKIFLIIIIPLLLSITSLVIFIQLHNNITQDYDMKLFTQINIICQEIKQYIEYNYHNYTIIERYLKFFNNNQFINNKEFVELSEQINNIFISFLKKINSKRIIIFKQFNPNSLQGIIQIEITLSQSQTEQLYSPLSKIIFKPLQISDRYKEYIKLFNEKRVLVVKHNKNIFIIYPIEYYYNSIIFVGIQYDTLLSDTYLKIMLKVFIIIYLIISIIYSIIIYKLFKQRKTKIR